MCVSITIKGNCTLGEDIVTHARGETTKYSQLRLHFISLLETQLLIIQPTYSNTTNNIKDIHMD